MQLPSRRTFIGLLSLALPSSWAPRLMAQSAPRPFRVNVPRATLNRILNRVKTAHWPDRLDSGWKYGANWDYMKSLASYWTTKYDWRKAETRLNRYPQFMAKVGDFDIHFYHVKGRGPRPLPVILTHGWPGSVVEFQEAIGPLTDPVAFGGAPEDSFDVIIPSLPGFGFSSKPTHPVGPAATARLWHELMTRVLGYSKFGAQGGDWGNSVTCQLAAQFPASLHGIHLNATAARPAPAGVEITEEERNWQRAAAAYRAAEADYFGEQQRKPETVAFALADSPLGTAAWMVEKFKTWSDSGDDSGSAFTNLTKDQLLTNVMYYLVSDTQGTGVWFYRGAGDENEPLPARINVPAGFAAFPREMASLEPPRVVLERSFNLVHYTKMPKGGHFACFEQPELFVKDLREFFRRFRG